VATAGRQLAVELEAAVPALRGARSARWWRQGKGSSGRLLVAASDRRQPGTGSGPAGQHPEARASSPGHLQPAHLPRRQPGVGGAAVIDERKATTLAALRFPRLRVLSTVDLTLAVRVTASLGDAVVADAVFDALTGARMRVPHARLADVVALVGPTRLASCHSLPSRLRPAPPIWAGGEDVA